MCSALAMGVIEASSFSFPCFLIEGRAHRVDLGVKLGALIAQPGPWEQPLPMHHPVAWCMPFLIVGAGSTVDQGNWQSRASCAGVELRSVNLQLNHFYVDMLVILNVKLGDWGKGVLDVL